MEIDAIEQRPRHARLVIGRALGGSAAGKSRIAQMAAPARVHCCDQLHTRREGDVRICPGNADIAGFERLPKRIQHGALEFRQLVEEQDPKVGKADLSRPNSKPAADERGHGRGMMR